MATTIIQNNPGADNLNTDSNKRFINLINNNKYIFNVSLITADGRYQELRMGAINNLVIEDNFANFYHSGYIVLNNTFDAVERVVEFEKENDCVKAQGTARTNNKVKGYLMRGDARDLLVVDIMPILDDDDDSKVIAPSNDEDANTVFRISLVFAIYNTEEILGNAPGQKFKKLYFWDIHYELLKEKDSYFTTANFIESETLSQLDDGERGILTGDAIKNFLTEFFSEEDGWEISVDEENFDKGESSIFFSSPAKFKGIDALQYLLSHHSSSNKNNFDQGFLRLDRHSSTFSFKSLADIFKTALADVSNSDTSIGSGYLETFKLGAYSESSECYNLERVDFTPAGALFLDKYGTINNFSYDPMPGEITQQNIATVAVHSYDFDCKQFQIDQERNSITSTLSVFKDNYVETFKKASKKFADVYENVFPGDYRIANKNIRNTYTIYGAEGNENLRLSQGRNKVLYNTIFMNSCINFRVPGTTLRQAGSFIGVNFDGASSTSEFNKKLLGVYLVLNVKHIFSGSEYFNELRCVKTYNYDKLLLNPESK